MAVALSPASFVIAPVSFIAPTAPSAAWIQFTIGQDTCATAPSWRRRRTGKKLGGTSAKADDVAELSETGHRATYDPFTVGRLKVVEA